MKKNTFLLGLLLILVACNSENTTENSNTETADSTETTIPQSSSEPISKPTITSPHFPFFGKATLSTFKLSKKHQYGGGDCMGEVFVYTLNNTTVTIDSMSCGDYGFTSTRYLLENGEIKMMHIAKIDNTLPAFEETIVDFRETVHKQYESKGTFKRGDFTQAYTNQPIGGNLKAKETVSFSPEKLKKEYEELFNRIVEDY